jgi:hypothetical protein
MLKVRIWQLVFLLACGAGVATVAAGGTGIGLFLIAISLLGFFSLVAIVGWVKAGQRK